MNAIRLVTEDAADPPPPDYLAPWSVRRRVPVGQGAHDAHIITHFRAKAAAAAMAVRRAAREQAARAIAGTPGGAMEARATRLQETIAAGVKLVEMQDADILSGMGLSRRQVDAAEYLRGLWADCLPGYEAPGAYGSRAGHGGKRHLTADQEAAAARAWFDYRQAMDRIGVGLADAVRSAVIMGEQHHPPRVRDGLDALADYWRMAR